MVVVLLLHSGSRILKCDLGPNAKTSTALDAAASQVYEEESNKIFGLLIKSLKYVPLKDSTVCYKVVLQVKVYGMMCKCVTL